MKLGEALVKGSLITKEQLRLALERQVIFGGRIGTNLVELGILKESDLSSFLSSFFKVPAVNPSLLAAIDTETISCMSSELAEKYKAIPFKKERNRLHVAMIDPRSIANVDELRFITRYDIIPYVISELRLLYALEKYYGIKRDLRYLSVTGKQEEETIPVDKDKERMAKVKDEFANAREREEVIGILLNESKRIASRAAIYIIKGDKLQGWKARGMQVENTEFTAAAPSVFTEVISTKHYYRGPLLRIPGNEPLIKALSGAPQDCIMIPLQIRDKVIALVYADNGNASVLDASLSYLMTLVKMASYGFEIVIMRKKIMEL